jgi:hypothetical protein
MDGKWLINTGRALGVVWALWWTVFGLLSGIGEGAGLLAVVMHTIMPGLIFLLAAALAWRWKPWGTIPLIVLGAWAMLAYDFGRDLGGLATLSLPPIVAGGLLLRGWYVAAERGIPGPA